jgi:hypothetical protein
MKKLIAIVALLITVAMPVYANGPGYGHASQHGMEHASQHGLQHSNVNGLGGHGEGGGGSTAQGHSAKKTFWKRAHGTQIVVAVAVGYLLYLVYKNDKECRAGRVDRSECDGNSFNRLRAGAYG